MAKCTITFEDKEDGKFDMSVEFFPSIKNPLKGNVLTPAQAVGWQFFEALSKRGAKVEGENDK